MYLDDEGYKRENYIKNHPKFQPVLQKYKITHSSTSTTTTTTTIDVVQVKNVHVNYEFALPMLNTSRLLLDENYRKYIQNLFFNTDNERESFILKQNPSDNEDLKVKECNCESISCICCVNITVEDLNFQHYSCVNITYDTGYEKFHLNIKNNQAHVYETDLDLINTQDLCLKTSHLEYCILFSELFYNSYEAYYKAHPFNFTAASTI